MCLQHQKSLSTEKRKLKQNYYIIDRLQRYLYVLQFNNYCHKSRGKMPHTLKGMSVVTRLR